MTKQELEICINQYGRDIYSFCKSLTRDMQEAEDLYQETFLTAVERLEKMDDENNPKSWLLSVALRLWRNKRRKFAWRRRIADIRHMGDETVPAKERSEVSAEERVLCREKIDLVRRAVDKLPKKLKIVTLLFYMEELSTAQIASLMGIPKGTVQSRLSQARKRLKRELEESLDGRME